MSMDMHFLPADEHSIQRMLSSQSIPPEVLPEYWVQLKMSHRNGGSGPLGHSAILCLLRQLSLGDTDGTLSNGESSMTWDDADVGDRVVVDFGEPKGKFKGVYKGRNAGGTVTVRLDDHEKNDIYPFAMVRLDKSWVENDLGEETSKQLEDAAGPKADIGFWSGIDAEAEVVVNQDGQNRSGIFLAIHSAGLLLVKLDGEEDTRLASLGMVSMAEQPV